MERLGAVRIEKGILIANRLFAGAFRGWAEQRELPFELQMVDDGATSEENRLGSIGDLKFALDEGDVRDDFLIVNGDNLFTFSLQEVVEALRRRGNTIVLYDVGSRAEAAKMGIAVCAETGRVIGFEEKPPQPTTTVVSVGSYAYRAEVRSRVEALLEDGNSPDKTGYFVEWLLRKTSVYGHPIETDQGPWFDIGSQEQLAAANDAISRLGHG